MGLTRDERVQAIIGFRFTERQARFLELVMRHGGVCVPRQYAAYAGVANGGEKCNAFFRKLVFRGRAVHCDCVHNRARVYHVHHRRLYQAIGESDSRYRRPVPARQAVERLMLLDAVLTTPDMDWRTTQSEKLALVKDSTRPESADRPEALTPASPPAQAASAVPFLPRRFPIGVDAAGQAVLLYLAVQPWTDDFRVWLQGHAALLQRLPTWTLCLVFPRPLDRAYGEYQKTIREEFETPLQPATIRELRSYFERRPKDDTSVHGCVGASLDGRVDVFDSPRFTALYRRWRKHGDSVLEPLVSPALANALSNGSGRVECLVLPYSYRHLAPVVEPTRLTVQPVEKGDAEGDRSTPPPQPPPLTPSQELAAMRQESERDWLRLMGRA